MFVKLLFVVLLFIIVLLLLLSFAVVVYIWMGCYHCWCSRSLSRGTRAKPLLLGTLEGASCMTGIACSKEMMYVVFCRCVHVRAASELTAPVISAKGPPCRSSRRCPSSCHFNVSCVYMLIPGRRDREESAHLDVRINPDVLLVSISHGFTLFRLHHCFSDWTKFRMDMA